jgi:hypothetical protein
MAAFLGLAVDIFPFAIRLVPGVLAALGRDYKFPFADYSTIPTNLLARYAADRLRPGILYTGEVGARYSEDCAGDCFVAPLQLPSGALVTYVELDWNDTNDSGYVEGKLVQCDKLGDKCTIHPAAGAGPADCLTPGYICSGTKENGGLGYLGVDVSAEDVVANNFNTSFRLFAGVNSTVLDNSVEIRGMIVGYVLQVSPPPPFADFNDVPTTHPLFRFIEALYHSGITAGCGGGNFCPDKPLTRGEMAVFLSTALGLQWN